MSGRLLAKAALLLAGMVVVPDAATLLFGARLSARLGDRNAMASYGSQLRNRFPGSPETRAFDEGRLE